MVYGTYNYSYWGLKTNLELGGPTLYLKQESSGEQEKKWEMGQHQADFHSWN